MGPEGSLTTGLLRVALSGSKMSVLRCETVAVRLGFAASTHALTSLRVTPAVVTESYFTSVSFALSQSQRPSTGGAASAAACSPIMVRRTTHTAGKHFTSPLKERRLEHILDIGFRLEN